MKWIILIFCLCLFLIIGCGSRNKEVIFDPRLLPPGSRYEKIVVEEVYPGYERREVVEKRYIRIRI